MHKLLTAIAFDISEELELPMILRTTTRLAHIRGPVTLGTMRPRQVQSIFKKDPYQYVCLPAVSRRLHKELLEKAERASHMADESSFNEIIGSGELGIVANGVSFNYVKDAVAELGMDDQTCVLKLGFSCPMPKELCIRFLRNRRSVLVVEELEPVMESELRAIAQKEGINVTIKGKGVGGLSRLYEYDPRMVRDALAHFCGIEFKGHEPLNTAAFPELPPRPPALCPGCPHRATFYAVGQVYPEDAIHATDIGCYALGTMPPLSIGDMSIQAPTFEDWG